MTTPRERFMALVNRLNGGANNGTDGETEFYKMYNNTTTTMSEPERELSGFASDPMLLVQDLSSLPPPPPSFSSLYPNGSSLSASATATASATGITEPKEVMVSSPTRRSRVQFAPEPQIRTYNVFDEPPVRPPGLPPRIRRPRPIEEQLGLTEVPLPSSTAPPPSLVPEQEPSSSSSKTRDDETPTSRLPADDWIDIRHMFQPRDDDNDDFESYYRTESQEKEDKKREEEYLLNQEEKREERQRRLKELYQQPTTLDPQDPNYVSQWMKERTPTPERNRRYIEFDRRLHSQQNRDFRYDVMDPPWVSEGNKSSSSSFYQQLGRDVRKQRLKAWTREYTGTESYNLQFQLDKLESEIRRYYKSLLHPQGPLLPAFATPDKFETDYKSEAYKEDPGSQTVSFKKASQQKARSDALNQFNRTIASFTVRANTIESSILKYRATTLNENEDGGDIDDDTTTMMLKARQQLKTIHELITKCQNVPQQLVQQVALVKLGLHVKPNRHSSGGSESDSGAAAAAADDSAVAVASSETSSEPEYVDLEDAAIYLAESSDEEAMEELAGATAASIAISPDIIAEEEVQNMIYENTNNNDDDDDVIFEDEVPTTISERTKELMYGSLSSSSSADDELPIFNFIKVKPENDNEGVAARPQEIEIDWTDCDGISCRPKWRKSKKK